jgi:hypothetical protein
MGLAWGCALLLGVSLTSCAAPQYKYIADSGENTYFKVPYSWRQVPQTQLCAVQAGQTASPCAGAWLVAYEADGHPSAKDMNASGIVHPFVYAEIGQVSQSAAGTLTDDKLRDLVLPVSATTRLSLEQQGYQLGSFKQLRDSIVTLPKGVHGVRDTYDYTVQGTTNTFDQIALTNQNQTTLWLIFLHCTASCYNQDIAAIDAVMSSFTVRS